MQAECADEGSPRGGYRPSPTCLLGAVPVDEQAAYHSRSRDCFQHLYHAAQRARAEDAVRIKEKDATLCNMARSNIASSGKTEITASANQFEPRLPGEGSLQLHKA